MKLLLATTNTHKIREIKAVLKKYPTFDLYSLMDFPNYIPPEETGVSFEENAILKAVQGAKTLNMLTVADDSGIVVPALGGAPGVYSARYAGLAATDKENRKKLLKEMAFFEGVQRSAYFECVIAFAAPEKLIKVFRGLCEGCIIKEEKGGGGFGYDPLFLKHDYNLTFGQIPESVKNQISHRGKAIEKFLLFLENFIVD